jgi:hypothetical protein
MDASLIRMFLSGIDINAFMTRAAPWPFALGPMAICASP